MGTKKPSIYDIAEAVGVSPAAVSYVIHGKNKVSPATRQRILDAMEKMGYTIDRAAASLSTGKSALVGVCFPLRSQFEVFSDNPFYSEFLAAFSKEAADHGYDVVVGYVQSPDTFEKWMLSRRLDGVVVFGLYSPEIFKIIRRHHIPFVLSDTYENLTDCSVVRVADEEGGYLAARYLLDQNLHKIAFVGGQLSESKVDAYRFGGMKRALAEENLEPAYALETRTTFDGGYEAAEEIYKNLGKIDAVFCGSDIVAIGLMRRLQELGVSIPDDISVIGFDNLQAATYVYPALTTIAQDISAKGQFAADSIFHLIEDPSAPKEIHILRPSLVIRNSVQRKN